MSINWERAELAPDKVLKVEGRVLLDLRAKINELEREIAKTKEDLRKTKEKLKETHNKLTGREKSLVKISEKFSSAKKNLDNVSESKLNTDIELTRIKPKLEELESKLKEANDTIIKIESELKFTIEKNAEMEQSIKFKDRTIENYKEDSVKRRKEIDNLNEIIKENQIDTEELIKKMTSLESKLTEMRASPKILEKIRDTMVHKGFITDRELENIFKEFE